MTEVVFKKWCARIPAPAQKQFERSVRSTLVNLFSRWELGNPIELTVLKVSKCGCLVKGIKILPQHDRYLRGGLRVAISTQNGNQVLICRMQVEDVPSQKIEITDDMTADELSDYFKKDSLEEIIRICQLAQ